MPRDSGTSLYAFGLVVCRNGEGKWLAVRETKNRGWWLPGGFVETGETFEQAAIRECREESFIDVTLTGILRVEYSPSGTHSRMRVIFFAVPVNEAQPVKTQPDAESDEARWVSISDLQAMSHTPPFLRGPELLEWATYIENGGMVHPLSVLTRESDDIPTH